MGAVSRGRMRGLGWIAALAVAVAPANAGGGEIDVASTQAQAERIRFFEQEIRPILATRCLLCHGAEKQKGGLRLDSREALLKGGETGPAVAPGQPAESPLIDAVRYEGLEMPPTGRLPNKEVAALAQWVAEGAVWPAEPAAATANTPRPRIEKADASFWSFQPLREVVPPAPEAFAGSPWQNWGRTPIDAFVLKGLLDHGLTPAPEANRAALLRRATFDLTGLPPTPAEVDAFLADSSPDAYETVVDRLLASPDYGNRWGRHWLDVVRYAESDGHNADAYRPDAWRFRDYVVRSLNADKPFDRFVAEQLAGDELAPADPDAITAAGFLRLGPYEHNQRDVRGQWNDILNEVTDVVGEAFLGLSVGCARCHDHKFDPIAQADYYRLRAFFAPMLPVDDQPLGSPAQKADHDVSLAGWELATAALREEIAAIEQPHRDKLVQDAVAKFTPDYRAMLDTADDQLSPLDRQLKALAYRQIVEALEPPLAAKAIPAADRDRWQALTDELKKFSTIRPAPVPVALSVRDVGGDAPPTVIPGGRKGSASVEPGYLSVFDPTPAEVSPCSTAPGSTGRRSALASWLNRPDNALANRVIVNRIWQGHFGRGIVATSNDFGKLGEAPSDPALLDWLARWFVADGRHFKSLHRLMVTSAAYRQSASRPAGEVDAALLIDPSNKLLWKRPVRRLEAEAIRDAMLAASGELAPARGGPPADAASSPRRSVEGKVIRNRRDAVLDAFDAPDAFNSAGTRNTTTTVTQTLLLINGPWALSRARALAARLAREAPDNPRERIALGYRLTLGRAPDDDEAAAGAAFLGRDDPEQALVDYCHVLLNSSEFLYLD